MAKMNYHTFSIDKTLKLLHTSAKGLSKAEVQKRQTNYGPNELKEKKKRPLWLKFALQFRDFMVLILVIAAIISAWIGDITDTIIILAIVVLNAIIGFVQEYRTEKAIEALKKLSVVTAKVIRNGQTVSVNATELVPGDITLLEAGNAIPADIRLMETHSLLINESALTGESVPINKNNETLKEEDPPLGDRLNMAYKGTLVTNGRAKGVVVATGMHTELGKIAELVQQDDIDTPLKRRITAFGKNLTYIILLICSIIFIAGWLRGENIVQMLLISISLAVAAIPEALPALMTVGLALGAKQMAKKNALIRKLPAVETLGSVTFICSDKTGTLTENKMTVSKKQGTDKKIKNINYSPLSIGMALNHDVKVTKDELIGEPTEQAIVENIIQETGMESYWNIQTQFTRIAELPFDSDRKCMTTVHQFNKQYLMISKGAPETIGTMLSYAKDKKELKTLAEQWAQEGQRVLAYGYKVLNASHQPFIHEIIEKELHWAGIIGMIDPPRAWVKEAIRECKMAGIHLVMITGDHPATAAAIAKEIGILNQKNTILSGKELQNLNDKAFEGQVENISVYARVSPEQKLRIVKALQRKNHFVGMTGDGVNDAPSLKAADIGIAMGINGTDVSKEAAEMILLDDNFSTIVKAVKEGRRIYDNIRKFVKYIMTCNSAEIWTIFLAPLIGLPMPLLPIHILWINLVTDGLPGLALAREKAEPDTMRRPPRPPNESIFAQGLGYHILWVGLLMAGLTLSIQAWAIDQKNTHWQTMVFTALSLLQIGHALAVRSERISLYEQGIFKNIPLLISILLTFILQLGVIYLPKMNIIFKTQPLTLNELLICISTTVILFHAIEFEKWIKKKHLLPR